MPQILTMLSSAATHLRGSRVRSLPVVVMTALLTVGMLSACQKAVSPPEKTHYVVTGNTTSPLWPQAVEDISEEVRITLNHGAPTPDMVVIEEDGRQAAFTGERHGDYLLVPRKFRHLRLLSGEQTVADIVLEKG